MVIYLQAVHIEQHCEFDLKRFKGEQFTNQMLTFYICTYGRIFACIYIFLFYLSQTGLYSIDCIFIGF
jgi:hypothetical protein